MWVITVRSYSQRALGSEYNAMCRVLHVKHVRPFCRDGLQLPYNNMPLGCADLRTAGLTLWVHALSFIIIILHISLFLILGESKFRQFAIC